jgi:hypothetical protein
MGAAFLVLLAGARVGPILLLVVLFVVGDLVWGPASEDAAVVIAPPGRQGTYLGVLAASIWLGSALAPGIGLRVRDRFGETVLWLGVAALGAASAAIYATAGRRTSAVARIAS